MIKPTDSVGVTFANTILGQGVLNGVVNISFGHLLFTPDLQEGTIEPDVAVCLRLRMDLVCAKQLRDSLIDLIDRVETAPVAGEAPPVAEGADAEKLN